MKKLFVFFVLCVCTIFLVSCAQPTVNDDTVQRYKKDISAVIQENEELHGYNTIDAFSNTRYDGDWNKVKAKMKISVPDTDKLPVFRYGLKTFSEEKVESIVGSIIGKEPVFYEIGQPSPEYYQMFIEEWYGVIESLEQWKQQIIETGPQEVETYSVKTGEEYIEIVDEESIDRDIESTKRHISEYQEIIDNYKETDRVETELGYSTDPEDLYMEEKMVMNASFDKDGEDYVLLTVADGKILKIGKRDLTSTRQSRPTEYQTLSDDGSYSRKIKISKKEAIDKAEKLVSAEYPEMTFRKIYPSAGSDGFGEDDVEYAWKCFFTRSIGNAEVSFEDHEIMTEELHTVPILYETISVIVNEEGIIGFEYDFPLQEEEMISENAKLMPIEDVLAIAKQYFSAQYYDDLVISDMKLSYTRIDKQNDKGHYYYVPVWDFYGKTSMIDPGTDLEIYSFLTINALDGTIIDRTYGY